MKKLLLSILLATTAVITIACSSPTKQNDAKSNEKEIVTKTITNFENLKSITIDNTVEENNTVTKSKIQVSKDPKFTKIHLTKDNKSSFDMYTLDNFKYISNEYPYQNKPKNLQWFKYTLTKEEQQTNEFYLKIVELTINPVTITETESTYEIITKDNDAYTFKAIVDKNSFNLLSSETITKENKITNTYSNHNANIDTTLPEEVAKAEE